MPRPSQRSCALLATVTVCAVLGLTGCSGGSPRSAASSSPSATASLSAVDSLIATGLRQLSSHDDAGAKQSFLAVLALEPHNVYGNYNLGYIAQVAGQSAPAIRYYTAAISSDPKFAPALYNLAILTESSDLPGAIALYRREIAVAPDDVGGHQRLGQALIRTGKTQEGRAMLALARQLQASADASASASPTASAPS